MKFETKCSGCGKTFIFDDENIIYTEPGQFLNDIERISRA